MIREVNGKRVIKFNDKTVEMEQFHGKIVNNVDKILLVQHVVDAVVAKLLGYKYSNIYPGKMGYVEESLAFESGEVVTLYSLPTERSIIEPNTSMDLVVNQNNNPLISFGGYSEFKNHRNKYYETMMHIYLYVSNYIKDFVAEHKLRSLMVR